MEPNSESLCSHKSTIQPYPELAEANLQVKVDYILLHGERWKDHVNWMGENMELGRMGSRMWRRPRRSWKEDFQVSADIRLPNLWWQSSCSIQSTWCNAIKYCFGNPWRFIRRIRSFQRRFKFMTLVHQLEHLFKTNAHWLRDGT